LRHREHTVEQRHIRGAHACAEMRTAAHLEQVTEQAETGDVGHRVHAGDFREMRASTIE